MSGVFSFCWGLFSDVYKFLFHVSQIISAHEEQSGAVVKSLNICVFLLGEMGVSSKIRNKSCARKRTGLKM
jgi:hypothetical protein